AGGRTAGIDALGFLDAIGLEDDVDPVVGRVIGLVGEGGAAVVVDAVAAGRAVLQRGERAIGDRGGGEVAIVEVTVADDGLLRGDVHRVLLDGYWRTEAHLLPTSRGFVGEGDGGEEVAGGVPEVAGVRAGVAAAFVEAESGEQAVATGLELH